MARTVCIGCRGVSRLGSIRETSRSENGQLRLTVRRETVPAEIQRKGNHDYSSAALYSKARWSSGYYEVNAPANESGDPSSFWFQKEDPKVFPGWDDLSPRHLKTRQQAAKYKLVTLGHR